ncbi:uncharacterized protein BDZ99DRAFT_171270 [Mytilinidion resinicola]|uniref:Uncharacterized protein n=1 Tax=Mytilinidion resinicola TaxID=574789 RepID=A0A6A6Y3X1_9PEZI|nr:uncharacterized protein BDZ99DRAFT_171270 [Mytilinidion resinicola]KAF2803350.1 hypothetical protein BDZ99DRAFT_171270 [Mytilinidion resinicola]
MMDAALQSGRDRAFLFQDGLDDFCYDALDGWRKDPSLYEDLQPVPAVWSSFDVGGGVNVSADEKQRLEPIARAVGPATYSHLKSQATSPTITTTSPNTANIYQVVASHICDDSFASFGLQTCADVASPELCFQCISHSYTALGQQSQHTIHDRREISSQPPTQPSVSTRPSFEQHQLSYLHMYSTPSSPSIAMPPVSSPSDGDHKYAQPRSFNASIRSSRSNVFSSDQLTYMPENVPATERVPTSSTSRASFSTEKPPGLPNIFENAIFSARAASSTPSEVQSSSFSAATPSTVASPGAQPPAKAKRKRDDYNLDNKCSEVAFKDKSGAVAAYTQVFGTARNLRQAYSEGQRKEIARTRKLGACDRCKRFKMKVSGETRPP